MFNDFCQQVGTKVAFASVYHLQSNDIVERSNALIFEAIKKILEGEKKGKWAEVMPRAVWSHNTTISRATNFTPLWLMYIVEVVLPDEVKHRSLRMVAEVPACPSEAEDEDLLEPNTLKAVAVTPDFNAKPNAHSMCTQKSSLHTYRIENGYRITNVSI
jgi:hypothetical protein